MPIPLVHVKLDRLPFVGEINCNTVPEIRKNTNCNENYISWQRIQGPRGPSNNIPPPFGVKTQMSISHQALVARALAALVDHDRRGRPEAPICSNHEMVQGPYMDKWKSHYDMIRYKTYQNVPFCLLDS